MSDPSSSSGAAPAAASPAASTPIQKLQAQVKKLNDANAKYKSLLVMAKERIQKQEEEMDHIKHEKEQLQADVEHLQDELQQLKQQMQQMQQMNGIGIGGVVDGENAARNNAAAAANLANADGGGNGSPSAPFSGPAVAPGATTVEGGEEVIHNIVQVCQRIKVSPTPSSASSEHHPDNDEKGAATTTTTTTNGDQNHSNSSESIWALLEMEVVPLNDMDPILGSTPIRHYYQWKKFDTESELQDYIRRDTGEPLRLPPYSLSPEQSDRIARETQKQISQITEEFRRFRVRAELARKQQDATIRDLQQSQFRSATQRIEGNHHPNHIHSSGTPSMMHASSNQQNEIEKLKTELAQQEAHWKEAYESLLSENTALKSSGSEALLASQWRQRYEASQKERDNLEQRVQMLQQQATAGDDKYEAKYRDLKESFRLYRKKAKEIFEAQERGGPGTDPSVFLAPASSPRNNSNPHHHSSSDMGTINDQSSAEARLSYLRNLMVNYLTSEQAVRDHMETAITMVLQFTPDEVSKIQQKKSEHESSWF